MNIIPMQEEHVSSIAELEIRCFSAPWVDASIRSELENPLSHWLVAVEDQKVVGYIGSQTVLGEADIMNVAVAPEFRRKGIAKALLLTLQDDLCAKDVHSLTLEVRASNVPAITLYEALGYTQVGRRPNYYHKPKEDALILRKEWSV